MQAEFRGSATAVEFIHPNDDYRVASMHRYPLRLACGGEADDLAEPCLGFSQLPVGKGRVARVT